MQKFAIGIDIGGTNTKFGIVDRNGHILKQDRLPTNKHEAVEDFIDELFLHLLFLPTIGLSTQLFLHQSLEEFMEDSLRWLLHPTHLY